jgi:hypothetical protein
VPKISAGEKKTYLINVLGMLDILMQRAETGFQALTLYKYQFKMKQRS